MINQILVLVLLASITAHVSAKEYECSKFPLLTTTKDDGSRIGLVASEEQLSNSATWKPGKGEPPLSVSKAVEIAEKWAKNEYKRYDSVKIEVITLSEYGCMSGKGYWYYTFHFAPIMDGSALHGSGHFAAVLMNGTVIGPVKLKGS